MLSQRAVSGVKLAGLGLLSFFSLLGISIASFLAVLMWAPWTWALKIIPVANLDVFRIFYASSYTVVVPLVLFSSGALFAFSLNYARKNKLPRKKVFYALASVALIAIFLAGALMPAVTAISATQTAEYNQFNNKPCTYYIFTDSTNYYGQNCTTGAIDYGGPSNAGGVTGTAFCASLGSTYLNLGGIMNTIAGAISSSGSIYVQAATGMGWCTTVTLKNGQSVNLESGGSYNEISVDGFLGNILGGSYHLNLDSTFTMYSATVLVHLTNSLYSNVFINTCVGNSLTVGMKCIYLDGNTEAFYNTLTILRVGTMDIGIHLPFVTVGANANYIPFIFCDTINYCVKIDSGVAENSIGTIRIGGGGIQGAGTHAGLYLNGTENMVSALIGEFASTAPLLYVDKGANYNRIQYLNQNGAGGTETFAAKATGYNYIGNVLTKGVIASPFKTGRPNFNLIPDSGGNSTTPANSTTTTVQGSPKLITFSQTATDTAGETTTIKIDGTAVPSINGVALASGFTFAVLLQPGDTYFVTWHTGDASWVVTGE